MKSWKFDLFNFKQGLTLDQLQISSIVEGHLQQFERFSEKELTMSLKHTLQAFSYDNDVKKLVESLDEELESQPLLYDLKDLYKKIERNNQGLLNRDLLQKILDIINQDDDSERMNMILSDLMLYDWNPDVKAFVLKYTSDPVSQKNMTSSGAMCTSVYTVVEPIENGHVAFIGNKWFALTEEEVKEVVLAEVVTDKGQLKMLDNMAKALSLASYNGEMLEFAIDSNLCICLDLEGNVYMNDEKVDKETTLEDLFSSSIIPSMKKNFYEVIKSVVDNFDKIVDLDVVCKVSNPTKAMTELYVFNYKSKLYLYSVDKRTGSSFYEYDSVNQLVKDIQKEMGYDISDFVNNKLSKEVQSYRKLEDKEKEINTKIQEVTESLQQLEENAALVRENKELKEAFDSLLGYKHELIKELHKVKNSKVEQRKRIS
jgi:hypothetical protein